MNVKVVTLINALLMLLLSNAALAQGPCPTANSTTETLSLSHDLICTVPQVYGAGGLVGVNNHGPLGSTDTSSAAFKHSVHFQESNLASFAPLTAEIGTALSQLPLTSPASGYIFAFNPSLGVYARSAENFGPILSERADTIGKHKLFVGISYQFFNFDKVDGVNLRNFSAVFQHEPEKCPNTPATVTCINGTGPPTITKDHVLTQNTINLKAHQVTAVATFGFTDRLDVSIAIPILDVRMDMTSNASIFNYEATDPTILPACCVHQFAPPPITVPGETLGPLVTAQSNGYKYYDSASFVRANAASGIGDIVFRGKYRVLKREKIGLALGLDLRLPTGDELNFLGSGAWGVRPFGTISYSGRFSPRASLGYQVNGSSVLGGNIGTDTSARLPDILTYSFGADYGVSTRISLSGDFLGQTLFDAKKIATTATTTLVADGTVLQNPDLRTSTGTSNQESVAVGGKVSPFGRFIITANVLFRVNDAGLHSKPVPLIGLSYTF
jgi:hypothetical protein